MPLPRAQNDKNGFWHPQPTHLAHHTYTAGAFPLHNLQFRAEIHHALLSQFSFLVKLLFCKQSECVVCSFVLFWCPYETANFGKVMKRQKPSKWVEVDRFQGLLHLWILRMYLWHFKPEKGLLQFLKQFATFHWHQISILVLVFVFSIMGKPFSCLNFPKMVNNKCKIWA